MSKKRNEKEPLILTSAGPINDGGRKWNIIYVISCLAMLVLFIILKSNMLGMVFAVIMGGVLGWIIKNKVMEILALNIRNTEFYIEKKISYEELINRLIPILVPLGVIIEKSSDGDGYPIISFQGSIYDITYNENESFSVWWRKNIVKAFFMVDNIGAYRKEVVAMGLIAYHVQQVCDHYKECDTGNISKKDESKKKECSKIRYCRECGKEMHVGEKFCSFCGTAVKE